MKEMTVEPLLNTKMQQGAREDKTWGDSLGTAECCLHCCRNLEEPHTSKLEELDQCDFPNGCCTRGVAGCWCCSQLQTRLWKGTESCRVSVTSVLLGSAPAASTWAAEKEPADMDAKEGKLPLPAYWDSRNVSGIHVDREDPTVEKFY